MSEEMICVIAITILLVVYMVCTSSMVATSRSLSTIQGLVIGDNNTANVNL